MAGERVNSEYRATPGHDGKRKTAGKCRGRACITLQNHKCFQSCGTLRRSNPVGRRSHPKPLWIASLTLAMTSFFVLALRFLFAPRGLPKLCTNGPPQREAERRKARG
jgi:hypothetical protein